MASLKLKAYEAFHAANAASTLSWRALSGARHDKAAQAAGAPSMGSIEAAQLAADEAAEAAVKAAEAAYDAASEPIKGWVSAAEAAAWVSAAEAAAAETVAAAAAWKVAAAAASSS